MHHYSLYHQLLPGDSNHNVNIVHLNYHHRCHRHPLENNYLLAVLLAATATGAAGAATVDAELALAAGADAFLPELLDFALLAADAAGLASSFLANLTSGFTEDAAAAGAVASTFGFAAAGADCGGCGLNTREY